jgi:hypothetical protein
MKPLASTVKNTGTLGGTSKAMSISVENMAHLQSVLSNLYSNPTLAVLREYSTNAFDAHVEAGVNKPIKISLPTSLSPTLMIEDFGIGMSTDQLLNMYSSYGASTKRGTNEQTGMLGLGSKSALSVTTQFTVRSRRGGIETTALIFLNDTGAGEIKIVDTKATNETGTLITLAVDPKDIRGFQRAAESLFPYWPDGSVTGLEGIVVSGFSKKSDWKWISPNVALTPKAYRYGGGTVTVVQGNVPYEIDNNQLSEAGRKAFGTLGLNLHNLVIIAPIGSLQFTPAREGLYYTNFTNDALVGLFSEYSTAITAHIQTLLQKAKNKEQAMDIAEEWAEYGVGTLTWNGQAIPTSIPCKCLVAESRKHTELSNYSTLPKKSDLAKYDYVVTNTPSSDSYTLRSAIARHANRAMVDRWSGGTAHRALFLPGDVPENWDWIGLPTIDWKAFGKAPKVKGQVISQAGVDYTNRQWKDVFSWNTYHTITDGGDGFIYIHGEQRENVRNAGPYTYVMVPKNMIGNFAKAFPKALSWEQARKAAQDKWNASVTDAMRKADRINSQLVQILADSKISHADLLDPNLRTVVELVRKAKQDKIVAVAVVTNYGALVSNVVVGMDCPEYTSIQRTYGIIAASGYEAPRFTKGDEALMVANAIYSYKHQGE